MKNFAVKYSLFLLLWMWMNCSMDNSAGIEIGNPNEDKITITMTLEVDTIRDNPDWLPKRSSTGAADDVHIRQFELNFHQIELVLDPDPDAPDIKQVNILFPGEPVDYLNDGIMQDTLDNNVHPDSDWIELQYEFYYPTDNGISLNGLNWRIFEARGVIKGRKGPYRFLVAMPDMNYNETTGNASPELKFAFSKTELVRTFTDGGYNIKLIFYAKYWLLPYDFTQAEAEVDVNGDSVLVFSPQRNADLHAQMLERLKNSFSEAYDTLGI